MKTFGLMGDRDEGRMKPGLSALRGAFAMPSLYKRACGLAALTSVPALLATFPHYTGIGTAVSELMASKGARVIFYARGMFASPLLTHFNGSWASYLGTPLWGAHTFTALLVPWHVNTEPGRYHAISGSI